MASGHAKPKNRHSVGAAAGLRAASASQRGISPASAQRPARAQGRSTSMTCSVFDGLYAWLGQARPPPRPDADLNAPVRISACGCFNVSSFRSVSHCSLHRSLPRNTRPRPGVPFV